MAKINIDFQVLPTYDPKTILVVDTSQWAHIESKPAIIEIILPGESKPVVQYFDKGKVNVFNSRTLGIACDTCGEKEYLDLDDGIYQITVKGSPDSFNYSRQFLKVDKTQLDLDRYITSIDFNCNEFSVEIVNKIQKINLFLEAAESHTRLGNQCEAQEMLFKAQKLISKLKGCKACV